ncbi:NAD-dependent succinate-semialdehyde dehydrogenase [Thalassobacillus sp. C254]|uniref:NAD-dependent succinate-semialdehyde dehydrogenase n=1 Tax=Thalassobacillus sp. C254 TaxID=1225341 RepID=UPI0006D28371|nr:NAD-dependent succinate-semialdehyde dehydrogenase [Thalassobacillus sp. C254]
MYINGKWITGDTQDYITVYNPADQQEIASVPSGGKKEAEEAAESAYKAFKTWSKTTAGERSLLLTKWFELIEKHKEDLAVCMTKEQGKPYQEALGEVGYANSFIQWYAEEGKRVYGDIIPASAPNKRIFVQKQPVGVAAIITPWNFPAAMITRKAAPALAAGCTVVIKPAEETPLTALKLVELAEEAGFPPGVINLVTGNPKEIGEQWLSDKRVRKVSFTGSTEVGKLLMRGAADTVKKLSLELGGQAPLIVMGKADVDTAVQETVKSKFRNAGQTCVCSNRIYVHRSVAGEFTEKLKLAVEQLKVGPGLEEGVHIGPLIDQKALEKVQRHVEEAKNSGAEIVTGGVSLSEQSGYYFAPTIIKGATGDMLCMNEETFGPVAPISIFDTEEEVVEKANDTDFGLAAYLFTEDLSEALRISENLEYGIVGVNDGLPSVPQAPFGGFKESGLGREGGYYGIEEYLEIKYTSLSIKQ